MVGSLRWVMKLFMLSFLNDFLALVLGCCLFCWVDRSRVRSRIDVEGLPIYDDRVFARPTTDVGCRTSNGCVGPPTVARVITG